MKLKVLVKKGICAACVIGVLSTGAVVFAEGEADTASEAETTEEVTEEKELKTIGEKPETVETSDETEKSYEVKLTNLTQLDITGVAIKNIDDEEYPENMLKENDVFAKEETRILYYTPEKEDEEDTSVDQDAKVLEDGYDIQLTLVEEDGAEKEVVLHAFPFEDAKEAEILFEDEVAFITYESEANESEAEEEKQTLSTKEAELAIKQTEAASEQPTNEEPVYEEPVYEEPVYEEPVYEAPVYEAPVYEAPVYEAPVYEAPVYEAPVYEAPVYEAPAGGDDSCVGDGLTY